MTRPAGSSLRPARTRAKARRLRFEVLESRNLLSLPPGPGLPGDANEDYVVDIFDINAASTNWGGSGPTGDANGDGIVNVFDINAVSANWGGNGAFSPVEVASLSLWYDAAPTRMLERYGAARFEADRGQFLSGPNPGLATPTQQMTVSFWMNQTTLGAARTLVTQYNYPSDGSWAINTGSSAAAADELWIWIADGPNAIVVPHATTYQANLQAGVWYHVAVVFDGSQTGNANRLKVYIDGERQAMAFVGSSLSPPLPSDVNHDGKVNIFDINVVSGNWGGSGAGDANGDGTVNVFDINLISTQWDIPAFDLNPNGDQIPPALRHSDAPLNVGKPVASLGHFDGSLDSLGIFSSGLLPGQIAALFNQGSGQEYADLSSQQKSGLLAWWDLDEPMDATRVDATSHGWNLADTTHVAQRQIVGEWRGIGGGPALSQTYNRRPDYVDGAINGHGAVYFDGVNDVLRAAVSDTPNDRAGSVLFVVRFAQGVSFTAPTIFSSADESNYSGYLFFAAYTVDPVTGLYDPDGELRFRIRWRSDNQNISEVGSTVVEPETTFLVNVSTRGRTTPFMMRINGVDQSIVATGAPTAVTIQGSWYSWIPGRDNVTVGAFQRAGGDIEGFANAYIGEVLTFNEFMSEAENRQVEQYLADKWGVTLPTGGSAAATVGAATVGIDASDAPVGDDGQAVAGGAVQVLAIQFSTAVDGPRTEELAAAEAVRANVASALLATPANVAAEPFRATGSLIAATAVEARPHTASQSWPAVDRALADREEPWAVGLRGGEWNFARGTETRSRLKAAWRPSTMLLTMTSSERLLAEDAR